MDYAGSACPTGWAVANAAVVSQATQAPLYGVLASIWGSNAGGNFTLPDLRGRATFGQDSGGSGRITAAGGNFDGTVIGGAGGQQNWTLTQAQLPAVAPTFTGTPVTPTFTGTNELLTAVGGTASGRIADNGAALNQTTPVGTISAITPAGTISNLGSGNAHPVLSNAAIVNKCVRF